MCSGCGKENVPRPVEAAIKRPRGGTFLCGEVLAERNPEGQTEELACVLMIAQLIDVHEPKKQPARHLPVNAFGPHALDKERVSAGSHKVKIKAKDDRADVLSGSGKFQLHGL